VIGTPELSGASGNWKDLAGGQGRMASRPGERLVRL